MDTVLTAPRSTFPDIVKLTEKNVQSGNVNDLKVVPGYYTVATDRGERLPHNIIYGISDYYSSFKSRSS